MGQVKNVICEPSEILGKIKIKILELISLNKTICNNVPNLQIPTSLPSLPSINPSQAVIDFLKDILAVVQGINFEAMRIQLIDWLVEQVEPLEKSLILNLKLALKNCYACKVNPTIPEWMFRNPISELIYVNGTPDFANSPQGAGINIELKKLDLTCLFHVNPYSEVGRLLYDGDKKNDLNTFLWEVIQDNNTTPMLWRDPVTQRRIAYFTYLENDISGPNAAYIVDSNDDGQQDSDPRPMVFKMQIHNDYYSKTLVTFLNDYMNSQNPLFKANKLIPNTIDLIYGTLTNKIKLPEECLTSIVEFETAIEDYINIGIENPDVTVNESFYKFTPEQQVNIKQTVRYKKNGVRPFDNCCGGCTGTVPFSAVATIDDEITPKRSTLSEKITVFKATMDNLGNEAAKAGVPDFEKDRAKADFFAAFLTGLQIALVKMTFSPKILMIAHTLYYLVNGQLSSKTSMKQLLKDFECLIKALLEELIRKLIYEFLLPLIIKALKDLIICVIVKKLKEKQIYKLLTMVSLLPGFVADKLDKLNQLLGKSDQIVESIQGFTDKINLNSLNNITGQRGGKGKFCD